jgi:hypothetical protein
MPMLSWDPFTTLSRLDRDFDELVRRTWGSPTTRPTAGFVPAVAPTKVQIKSSGPQVIEGTAE